jgi:hypothetical protein
MAIAALEAEAFLVWPRLGVKRHARRLGRLLGGYRPGGRPPAVRVEQA